MCYLTCPIRINVKDPRNQSTDLQLNQISERIGQGVDTHFLMKDETLECGTESIMTWVDQVDIVRQDALRSYQWHQLYENSQRQERDLGIKDENMLSEKIRVHDPLNG